VREGVGEGVGRWFDDNVRRKVGDGRNTLFWYDTWVGDTPLRLKFPRLFELAVEKESKVGDMRRLGWDSNGNAWVWCNNPIFARFILLFIYVCLYVLVCE